MMTFQCYKNEENIVNKTRNNNIEIKNRDFSEKL